MKESTAAVHSIERSFVFQSSFGVYDNREEIGLHLIALHDKLV